MSSILENVIAAEKLKPFRVTLPKQLQTPEAQSVVIVACNAGEAIEIVKGNGHVYPPIDYSGCVAEPLEELPA